LRAILALLSALAIGAPISASATFIGVTDARQVVSQCYANPIDPFSPCPLGPNAVVPTSPFSLFDRSSSTEGHMARQTSSFSSTVLEGGGQAVDAVALGPGTATSLYRITFDVDAATPYALSGVLGPVGFGSLARLALTMGTTSVFEIEARSTDGIAVEVPFDESGVLAPGRYELLALATENGPSRISSFQFRLEAVPEPHTAVLLGAGLGLLGILGRGPSRAQVTSEGTSNRS